MSYNFLFKYIVVGDSSVGKSCLVLRFTDRRFRSDHDLTIGVDFSCRSVEIDGSVIKLQIWDTAGSEAYRSIARSYCRGACAAFLVYDVSRSDSFNHLARWLAEAQDAGHPEMVVMLVGNKCDLSRREVTYEDGAAFASAHGLIFREASALTSQNVDEVFIQVAERIHENLANGVYDLRDPNCGIRVGDCTASRAGALPEGDALSLWTGALLKPSRCSC